MKDKHGRRMNSDPSLDKPAHLFWGNVDRSIMQMALQSDDKYASFLASMSDPLYARMTMPGRMKKFNISLHELQVLYNDHNRMMGLMRASTALPQIMVDVATDALNKQRTCPVCEGAKVVESTSQSPTGSGRGRKKVQKRCIECEGTGQVTVQGDKDARSLMFESMKLTKVSGGPLVNINQSFGNDSQLDTKFESLMKLTQSITAGNDASQPNKA